MAQAEHQKKELEEDIILGTTVPTGLLIVGGVSATCFVIYAAMKRRVCQLGWA